MPVIPPGEPGSTVPPEVWIVSREILEFLDLTAARAEFEATKTIVAGNPLANPKVKVYLKGPDGVLLDTYDPDTFEVIPTP